MTSPQDHEADLLDEANDFDAGPGLIGGALRHIALLAAWIATCGSLFLSEVLGWVPCLLCWYQRFLMYPLSIILLVSILRRSRRVHLYVLPLSISGACVSLYHYLLIKTDWLPPPPCTVGVRCDEDYIDKFGFINTPFMALIAFLIITASMIIWAMVRPDEDDQSSSGASAGGELAVPAAQRSALSTDALAAIMIAVGVVLSFVLASTFV